MANLAKVTSWTEKFLYI